MKTIKCIILISVISLASCQESEITKTAKLACECISNTQEQDREAMTSCTDKFIKENGEALKEYIGEDIPITDENGEVRHFYQQLVYMKMISDQCPSLIQGK